uniref:Uncharacterized protein n=1 Tax=Trichogramma kaykai TaxID=54128 RepID=A0ABD2WXX6_9HYME
MDDMIFNRSATGTLQHMQQSMESGEAVYGVMKQSALVQLTHFNIITGFVPCSMHCINLGIAKQFIKYWLDTSNNPYSLNNQDIALIDDILTRIKVPNRAKNIEYTICNCVNVTDIFQNHNLNNFHIKKCSLLDDTLHAVNTCDIDKICLLVQNEQEIYISPVPNLSSY